MWREETFNDGYRISVNGEVCVLATFQYQLSVSHISWYLWLLQHITSDPESNILQFIKICCSLIKTLEKSTSPIRMAYASLKVEFGPWFLTKSIQVLSNVPMNLTESILLRRGLGNLTERLNKLLLFSYLVWKRLEGQL